MRTAILVLVLSLVGCAGASAQGVRDPSTPNAGVIIVNPPAGPSRPTATPNIPPASAAPPLGVRPAYRYGNRGYRGGGRTRTR